MPEQSPPPACPQTAGAGQPAPICPLAAACERGNGTAPALLQLFIREMIAGASQETAASTQETAASSQEAAAASGPPPAGDPSEGDFVDRAIEMWRRHEPDFDARDLSIRGRIYRIESFFRALEARQCAALGINGSEFLLLAALKRSGPPYALSPSKLHESLLVVPSAVTKIVRHLSQLGLVTRRPDLNDRRAVLVQLTASGHEVVSAVLQRMKAESPFVRALDPAELTVLVSLLRKVLLALEG